MSQAATAAYQHAAALYQQRQDARLAWHNERLAQRLEDLMAELADSATSPEHLQHARLAACFLPLGYALHYTQPREAAARELRALGVPEAAALLATPHPPDNPAGQLLADAWAVATYLDPEAAELQLLERELMTGRPTERLEWAQLRLSELLALRWATPLARLRYAPTLAQRILEQKNRLGKLARNPTAAPAPEEAERFAGLEPDPPARLAQTFFRTTFRNHIHLSAIADNKAHIMISVNAILISVLISLVSYRNLAETNPTVLLPVVIFLVTGLASLVCAVLSARPRVTRPQPGQTANPAFFGHFVDLSPDAFEKSLDSALRHGSQLYSHLSLDLYHLGRVLDRKYRYLTLAYNLFMGGLVATVISFLAMILGSF